MRRWIPVLLLAFSAALAGCRDAKTAGADELLASQAGDTSLACYRQAHDQSTLSEQQALELCRGAPSEGPAKCFLRADDKLFRSEQQNIQLCRCAPSGDPVDCFERADQETFLSDDQIQELCAPAVQNQLLANCRPAT